MHVEVYKVPFDILRGSSHYQAVNISQIYTSAQLSGISEQWRLARSPEWNVCTVCCHILLLGDGTAELNGAVWWRN
jgi:hypothetical protein